MTTPVKFADAGEYVTCTAGHRLLQARADLRTSDYLRSSDFTSIHPEMPEPTFRSPLGSSCPVAECGGIFAETSPINPPNGRLHFERGWSNDLIREARDRERVGITEQPANVKQTGDNATWTPATDPTPRPSHWAARQRPPGSADAPATHDAEKAEGLPRSENPTLSNR